MLNEVIVLPPLAAENDRDTCVLLTTDALTDGVSGTVVDVALAADDAVPVPIAFMADTR